MDDVDEYIRLRKVPEQGIDSIEAVLDKMGYNYRDRGVKMDSYSFTSEEKAYVVLLVKRRRSRRDDQDRKRRHEEDAGAREQRLEWYRQRHEGRRKVAKNDVNALAAFNVSFLLANLSRRNLTTTLTRAELLRVSVEPCHYCGDTYSGSIDRIDSRLSYTVDNIFSSCSTCNVMKAGMHADHFKAYCVSVLRDVFTHQITWRSVERADKFSRYKKAAEQRGRRFSLTENEFASLLERPCTVCKLENANGIDRIDENGHYELSNCQPMCFVCNYTRGSMSMVAFLEQCRRVGRLHSTHSQRFVGVSKFTSVQWQFGQGEPSMVQNEERVCSECGQEKAREHFTEGHGVCKECRADQERKQRRA